MYCFISIYKLCVYISSYISKLIYLRVSVCMSLSKKKKKKKKKRCHEPSLWGVQMMNEDERQGVYCTHTIVCMICKKSIGKVVS